MNAMCRRAIFLLGFPLALFAPDAGAAQQAASPAAAPGATQTAPPMHVGSQDKLEGSPAVAAQRGGLTLNVVVTDRSGKLVAGLKQQDFTVLEDKRPQEMLSFRAVGEAAVPANAAAAPVEVILLVDTVNTGIENVARERQEIDKFLRSNGGQLPLPVTLIVFSDTRTQVLNQPSRDGNGLAESLKSSEMAIRTLNRSAGFDGAVERFQLSMTTIQRVADYEAGKPGRKLVIWVSPGWPLLSGPGVDLTSNEQKVLYGSLVSLMKSLRRAGIVLYSVDPLGTDDAGTDRTLFYQSFLNPVKTPNKMDAGDLGLQVVALHTGGLALNSNNDVAGEIERCLQDASGSYVIAVPAVAGEPDQYHGIDVKVATPGLTVRTLSGYYGQP